VSRTSTGAHKSTDELLRLQGDWRIFFDKKTNWWSTNFSVLRHWQFHCTRM